MKVLHKAVFEKMLKKLSREKILFVKETQDFFIENPDHPSLRNHPLDPPLEKYRTISVDADLRILFRMIDTSSALFLKIGTHDEIYTRTPRI